MITLPAQPPYDTDKVHGYMEVYEPLFRPLAAQPIRLLELGVRRGGSLQLWRDYFPQGIIVGLDKDACDFSDPPGRVHVVQGWQEDTVLLSAIAKRFAPEGFDIIIDDASHLAQPSRISFWHLFDRHLKPDGLYAIEDWGTGYWDSWPDGRAFRPRSRWKAALLAGLRRCGLLQRVPSHTHRYGMVGLVKELIDEQGMAELTRGGLGQPVGRESKFRSVLVTQRVVIVTKADT